MIFRAIQWDLLNKEIFMIFVVADMLHQRVKLNILNCCIFQDHTGVLIRKKLNCSASLVQHFLLKKIWTHLFNKKKMQYNLIIADWVKNLIFFHFMKKGLVFRSSILMVLLC